MNATRHDVNRAFHAGYDYGRRFGPCTPREAEFEMLHKALPTYGDLVTIFCNGADDGTSGDNFRLRLYYS